MRIILSRKGVDSSSGGMPSPIFPDGRMVSLPIPDKQSPIRYEDIHWQEYSLGSLVAELSQGRIAASHRAHLDPDINSESLSRHPEWRPIFGQTGAAQGHLRNNHVQAGDLFLYFGLFRDVVKANGRLVWDTHSPLRHVVWGWLQVDEVLGVAGCDVSKYRWAGYHPHFYRGSETNNTLYLGRRWLTLAGLVTGELPGAGVFLHCREQLVLTARDATNPSQWELPAWFFPDDDKCPLTYHSNLARWRRIRTGTRLNAVSRGQEFVLDTKDFPEAMTWLESLLDNVHRVA